MPEAGRIVLDEPAAALDPLAELGVKKRFGALTRGRPAPLISHRVASARQCDRILVLDGGRMLEDGTPRADGQGRALRQPPRRAGAVVRDGRPVTRG